MDDRKELNFHTDSEQHEVRIRNAIMLDGHATKLPTTELGQVWTSLYSDSQNFVGEYDKRVRANLHHATEYRPCTIKYPTDAS